MSNPNLSEFHGRMRETLSVLHLQGPPLADFLSDETIDRIVPSPGRVETLRQPDVLEHAQAAFNWIYFLAIRTKATNASFGVEPGTYSAEDPFVQELRQSTNAILNTSGAGGRYYPANMTPSLISLLQNRRVAAEQFRSVDDEQQPLVDRTGGPLKWRDLRLQLPEFVASGEFERSGLEKPVLLMVEPSQTNPDKELVVAEFAVHSIPDMAPIVTFS